MTNTLRRILPPLETGLSALAVYPTLYVWGTACLLADVAIVRRPATPATVFLLATSLSVYLADRVKLCDAWHDPADEAANPIRDHWVWRYRRPIRAFALLSALVGVLVALTYAPVLAPAPFVGQLAVWLYAGTPRGSRVSPRLKDHLPLKNLAAASGIIVLSTAATTIGSRADTLSVVRHAALPALLIVACDCLLCDIPDRTGDRDFGTQTVPVVFGVHAARIIAGIVTTLASLWLLQSPSHADHVWAWSLIATTWPIAFAPAGWLRSMVDLRLPLLALAIALV